MRTHSIVPKVCSVIQYAESIVLSIYPAKGVGRCALVLSGLELLVLSCHEHRLWNHIGLPWHGRVMLGATICGVTAGASWLFHWIICAAAVLSVRYHMRIVTACALCTLSAIAASAYLASWSLMWRTGIFADWHAIVFASRNVPMLFHYLRQNEMATAGGLVASGAIAAAFTAIVLWSRCRAIDHSPSLNFHWQMRDGLLVLAMSGILVGIVAVAYGDPPRAPLQTGRWWQDDRPGRSFALGYQANPLLTAIAGPAFLPAEHGIATRRPENLGPKRITAFERHADQQRPRLSAIVVQIESLRHDVLFMQHQGTEIMPVLNGLATHGLQFTRAYAQSTHSNYSDPALLSSLYPLRTAHHHYYSVADPWPRVLIYDIAKLHGYRTAIISSQNETWGGMNAFLETPQLDLLFDSRSVSHLSFIPKADTTFARYATSTGSAGKLNDRVTVEKAIEWISHCTDQGVPFVVCMNLQSSHFPYELDSGCYRPFQPCAMDFGATFLSYPIEKVPIVRNAYFNALHYIDCQLGMLLESLNQRRLRESTLLVVIGDNGECFYENGYGTHAGPPYEPAIHVPLVMNCPGRIAPRKEPYLTQGIDVVPTTLGLVGLPASPCFQGEDVLRVDRTEPERRLIFIHSSTLMRASSDAVISDSGWKYVFDRSLQSGSLYDLRNDPTERNPCEQRHVLVAETLDRILRDWRSGQLAYYERPSLYGVYFPPRTPRLSDDEFAVLHR